MKNIHFHFIKARNILCFGPEGIEINFSNYKNIVQVKGINLDAPGSKENPASNGTGKSSIQELISIALFGKTIKSPTKNKTADILNVMADDGEIEIQWESYRVLRKFKRQKNGSVKATIEFWNSPQRIWDETTSLEKGVDDIKEAVAQAIGLTHHAFCNVVVFDDSNSYAFLESDLPMKRQLIENLLDLEKYRGYNKNCKDKIKAIKKEVSELKAASEQYQKDIESCDRRMASLEQQQTSWINTKKIEITQLAKSLAAKQESLKTFDANVKLVEWQNIQDRVPSIEGEIKVLEEENKKGEDFLEKIKVFTENANKLKSSLSENKDTVSSNLNTLKFELSSANNLIQKLSNLDAGAVCPTCLGIIDEKNYSHVLSRETEKAASITKDIVARNTEYAAVLAEYTKKVEEIRESKSKFDQLEMKINQNKKSILEKQKKIADILNTPKPETNTFQQIAEAEMNQIKTLIIKLKNEIEGETPYKKIIDETLEEKQNKILLLDAKLAEMQKTEQDIPYYEYWEEAFGDDGIRKIVINNMIPALNEKIAYWLNILIDGLIDLKFDNSLEETIYRNGNPASYTNMSNGEVQRINLAVSQAFAYATMLNSGFNLGIVFLDEITGGGIDNAGIPYVYNMVHELAKERQVFVTTHNDTLMNLLDGCDKLVLKKENDITKIVS